MNNLNKEVKVEPVPSGRHLKLAGHHWLREVDADGRYQDIVVCQWNPDAKRWLHSSNVGCGTYLDTEGWEYLQPCPTPGTFIPKRQMEIREFHILSDASNDFRPIDGVCQFLYKGFQISISTSGLSHGACQTPVCVFTGENFQQSARDGFNTVEEAIDWINGGCLITMVDK